MTDARRYFGGLAAEDIAARHYLEKGATVLARRWRSPAGEVDLILQDGSVTVFVEVKARQDHAAAAAAISPRQWARVAAAAEVYMEDAGQRAGDMRLDAALVDATGRLEVIENAGFWE